MSHCYSKSKVLSIDVAEVINIRTRFSESFNVKFNFTDNTGTPFDLTPYTLEFRIVNPDGTVAISALAGSGLTVAANEVDIDLTTAMLTGLAANNYTYELRAVNGTYEKTWLTGQFSYYSGVPTTIPSTFDVLRTSVYIQGQMVTVIGSNA